MRDKNSVIRAWIYDLLATLELQEIEDAERKESGSTVTIIITFKEK